MDTSICTFTALLCAIALFSKVQGFPGGAPTGACTTMMPRHMQTGGGFIPAATTGPFHTIMASRTNYSTDSYVRVWITDSRTGSDSGYRGVLLQARAVGGNSPLGVWRNPPSFTKLITCSNSNDAVTHANVSFKNAMSMYEWRPTGNHGNIEFVATVAQQREVFWVQLKSQALQYSSAHLPTPLLPLTVVAAFISFLVAH